ncbi:hypothetical protein MUK42_11193 [Musa troglodytarum]|uniref:Uncharacterized protein n=1 Tax=Musa troglodytarum TaxID=320322 RepID=A0A9E7GLS6_9LILI|nr:hypothetical protein MUK42_11193 [Musa troglodytarum]
MLCRTGSKPIPHPAVAPFSWASGSLLRSVESLPPASRS